MVLGQARGEKRHEMGTMIRRLWDLIRGKRRSESVDAIEQGKRDSMHNVNRNATRKARTDQSAQDAAAERADSPAEEGGEG